MKTQTQTQTKTIYTIEEAWVNVTYKELKNIFKSCRKIIANKIKNFPS